MAQYDIMTMMNLGPFEFKEFIIKTLNNSEVELTIKSLNYWYFNHVFASRDIACEFLFFYYQYNFYPKVGGWRRDQEGTRSHMFSTIKSRIEQGFEKRMFDEDKLK